MEDLLYSAERGALNKLEEFSKKYGISKAQIVKDAIIEKVLRLEKLEREARGDDKG